MEDINVPPGSNRLELNWYNKGQALLPTSKGRYDYRWVDPRDPRVREIKPLVLDQKVSGKASERAADSLYSPLADLTPTEDNLAILGESGDVLKTLLRDPGLAKKYRGKVKLAYIDPPFNTGEMFAHYDDSLEHSIWLTLMRDRLVNIHKLLANEGSIWVHLDHKENHRMRMLLDEAFGPGNFVAEVVWEKVYSPRNDSKGVPAVTDVILVYRKSAAFAPNSLPRTAEMNARYTNPDNDPKGPWKMDNPCAPGAKTHQGMVYAIQQPITGRLVYPAMGACWPFAQETMLDIIRGWGNYELVDLDDAEERARMCGIPASEVRPGVKGIIIPGWDEDDAAHARQRYEDGNWPLFCPTRGGIGGFARKVYLDNVRGRIASNFLPHEEVGHNDSAKKEIKALFPGKNPFDTPKPERLLERIIHIATNPGDIVLDVFAGSGTTAAVAHKMGRRWVTAELSESNFTNFTVPRLIKVVDGTDQGGITTTKGSREDATEDGLPEGLTPEEAQKLTSLLNKAIKGDDTLKSSKDIKAVKKMVKTVAGKDTVNWLGGGSFHVAHLAPSVIDYYEDLDLILMADEVSHEALVGAVSANLGYTLTPDDPHFDGFFGRTLLVVVKGLLNTAVVDNILPHIPEGHSVALAAIATLPDVPDYLRENAPRGSRIIYLPSDLF